ncbi:MAG: membrane protein insertion efficiency factor YidD [Ignavibacteria bacterium]|nr:membrane protein insertion efficiency factor YidD [Ignavibacteria bacterium]
MSIIAIYIIRFYKLFISPLLPDSCRFEPSCSEYSIEAFRVHGFFKGSYLTVRRILRCNPFCKCGYDPVPEQKDRSHKQNNFYQKIK